MMPPEKAVVVLRNLIAGAAELERESFGSPKRYEWTDTAQGALEQAFAIGSSILENFRRARSIVFKAKDSDENRRKAANETLLSEIAVLRSAIKQLEWQLPEVQSGVNSSAATRQGIHHGTLNEGPVKSSRSTFDVGDADHLIVDGYVWKDTRVDDETELRYGHFYGSSVAKVAQLSFQDLAGYFDGIEIAMPNAQKDLLDWEFAHVAVALYSASDSRIEVAFRLEYDLEFWAKEYSIADLASAVARAISNHELPFAYWQRNANTAIEGFGVSATMSLKNFVRDALSKQEELGQLTRLIRAEVNEREERAVKLVFDFPPAIKSACEQYLMYFVQFLSDLGIEARAELRESARSVLFSVTPEDERQALERIWEALQMYLGLPGASDFAGVASQFHDVAVSQLQANVLHLQSQIMLAQAAIEMKNATIDAKEERIGLLEEGIYLKAFQPQQHLRDAESAKEELVKGIVAVKKWDYKFLEFNFPELLRKLKRKFN